MSLSAWFDPRGRLSRRAYARFVVRLLLLSVVLLGAVVLLAAQGWREAAFAALGGIAVLWLAGLAQTVRRLHDRARTGWWVSLSVALTALSAVPVEAAADTYPVAVVTYTLITLAASVWLTVETLGRRGTPGPNRYGPEPPAPFRVDPPPSG